MGRPTGDQGELGSSGGVKVLGIFLTLKNGSIGFFQPSPAIHTIDEMVTNLILHDHFISQAKIDSRFTNDGNALEYSTTDVVVSR